MASLGRLAKTNTLVQAQRGRLKPNKLEAGALAGYVPICLHASCCSGYISSA